MRSFWRILTKPVYLPFIDKLEDIYRAFSPSGRALFLFFSAGLVISSVSLLYMMNDRMLFSVPAYGGTLTEGIIGSPRFINPVLAMSDADRDLTTLVYSGLLRANADGGYTPDLAKSYTVSSDGLVYTFELHKDAVFSDGKPLTAEDVIFTIAKIQDPAVKSPLRASWEGVVVEAPDAHTLRFTLKSPYAPFIENLTLGILPKHLWQSVSSEEFTFSELNTSPIGSGPFKVADIARTASGIPASYNLVPFSKYIPGKAYLSHLILKFYQSEAALIAALRGGEIESASSLSPALLPNVEKTKVEKAPLSRVFGVFFNQNQSEVLRDPDVRAALEMAVNREELIARVLGGFGTAIRDPIPPNLIATQESVIASTSASGIEEARNYLARKGWKEREDGIFEKTTGTGKNASTKKLSFSVSTGNVPELRAAAEYLRQTWRAMGAEIDVKIFDQGDLSQNVIRPRAYDALLFGEVVGRELDLYAFWDSSQRNDPGLNIALYANTTVDDALKALRSTQNPDERAALYSKIRKELKNDIPAVFLYTPDFVYSVPNDIKGLRLGFIETPSDRFAGVSQWHRETDYVWPLFVKK
jgi:peptide/nickel transport system substrate-binding protein